MGFDANDFNARVADKQAQRNADIRQNIQGREALLKKVYIDLSTARDKNNALKISIPFKSVVVEQASDPSAVVNLVLGDNNLSAIADSKQLKQNDSFQFESTVSSAYLWWDAQSGKSLYLVFATTGNFFTGSQLSTISGGVTTSDGASVNDTGLGASSNASSITIASSATLILPQDLNRKVAELYVNGGDIMIGGSAVTTGKGVPRLNGERFEWRNTAALYGILVNGAPIVTGIVQS